MKKKCQTSFITHWLKDTSGGRYYNFGYFFSFRRPNQTPQEGLKSFKFANVMYYKT